MKRSVAFIGTYSNSCSSDNEALAYPRIGIHVYELGSGKLMSMGGVEAINASYLTLDKSGHYLYTVNELQEYQGHIGGAVSAFSFDWETLMLRPLNSRLVSGTDPCYVEVSPDNRFLLCANYTSGSVTVLPILIDGSLGEYCCMVQHTGSSVNPLRQEGPHAHGIFFSPSGKWVYVTDLGADQVVCYRLTADGMLYAAPERNIPVPTLGLGPRHMAFHPSGKYLYLNTEMGSTVHAYTYDDNTGQIELLQSTSTVPEDTPINTTSTAAIKIHPNGNLLYVSNRGHNSLSTFRIDEANGTLTMLSIQSSGGKIPRDFDISPDGDYLLAAHQSSNNIVLLHVMQPCGTINHAQCWDVFNPACVKIFEIEK